MLKLHSDSYNFNIPNYEYDNQTALAPTIIKGEGIELKSKFAMKK
jgi:hypothetical protein